MKTFYLIKEINGVRKYFIGQSVSSRNCYSLIVFGSFYFLHDKPATASSHGGFGNTLIAHSAN